MTIEILELELPSYWASALINGDTSGLEDEELGQLEAFEASMIAEFGKCWAVSCSDDSFFKRYHDASFLGVLACDCLTYTFHI